MASTKLATLVRRILRKHSVVEYIDEMRGDKVQITLSDKSASICIINISSDVGKWKQVRCVGLVSIVLGGK